MKVVLDTNKLYSFFWSGSLIKKLLLSEHELYAPEFALTELDKHKSEIVKKAGLASEDFEEFKEKLKKVVSFIPFSIYAEQIPEALALLPKHPKDVDFLALALQLNAVILSKDKELKKQSRIEIFDDARLSELL